MPIRWYIVRAEDNNRAHDVATEGITGPWGVGTYAFRPNFCLIRVDVPLVKHNEIISQGIGVPVTELAVDKVAEETHVASRFSSLPSARRTAILNRLSELGFNSGLSGNFTIRDLLKTFWGRDVWPRL